MGEETCLCVCGRDPGENRASVWQEGEGRFSGAMCWSRGEGIRLVRTERVGL